MTLFISFLLIYNFHMDWWWYGIAIGVWSAHFAFTRRKQLALTIAEQLGMQPRDLPDLSRDVPREVSREAPRDVPRDVPREVPREVPRDTPREVPRNSKEKDT